MKLRYLFISVLCLVLILQMAWAAAPPPPFHQRPENKEVDKAEKYKPSPRPQPRALRFTEILAFEWKKAQKNSHGLGGEVKYLGPKMEFLSMPDE